MGRKFLLKNFAAIIVMGLMIFAVNLKAEAAGLFGAPQTVSRETGGLNTTIGYLYHEDTYKNGIEHTFRQNQIYSQAGYGAKNIWEIYGRLGVADLKISDAFSSTDAATSTAKINFEENWKFFGTLGAKAFWPVHPAFGIGAFIQGTYYFSRFTDDISGTSGGSPFTAQMKVENLWDAACGAALQITIARMKFYAGPYLYYSEAKTSLDADIAGLEFPASGGKVSLINKSVAGGFAGADVPLIKGFRLNVEAQYADRWSAGAAVSYTY